MVGVFGVLWWLERNNKLPWGKGAYLMVYLIGYAAVRFVLEGLRINPWITAGVPVARWISAALFIGAVLWLVNVVKNQKDINEK